MKGKVLLTAAVCMCLAGCSMGEIEDTNAENSGGDIYVNTVVTETLMESTESEQRTMLVVCGGTKFYDLESSELFDSYLFCADNSLSDGDVVKISCVVTCGSNEIAGNYSDITDIISCEKASLSSAKNKDAPANSTVGVDISYGIIDITDPSNGERTVIFFAGDKGFGAVSDRWEGVRFYEGYSETENSALYMTNGTNDTDTLFVGYMNDPLANCEAECFCSEDITEVAEYTFKVGNDLDRLMENIKEKGLSQEVIDSIFSMELNEDNTIVVFCGEFSVDPERPVVINSSGSIAPSKGDDKANIIIVNADSGLLYNFK